MSAYSQRVLADGAVAYWRLNETSGTTITGLVSGYTGTISGGVTLNQPGALSDGDKAMAFDGATSKIVVPNGAYAATGTGPLSVEFWFNQSVPCPASNWFALDSTSGSGVTAGFDVMVDPSGAWRWQVNNGTTNMVCSSGVGFNADGRWHHFVGVVTRGGTDQFAFYIDGVLRGGPVSLPAQGWNLSSTQALVIGDFGGDGTPSARRFTGLLDELAIYLTALTPAQIATHYALAAPTRGAYGDRVVSDGASAYWRLGELSGTSAFSEIGGYTGTISGTVTRGQAGALSDGNKAMTFNPTGATTDGSISVPVGSYSAVGTGPVTLECWTRLGPGTFSNQLAFTTSLNILGTGTGIGFRSNGLNIMFRVMAGAGTNTDAATPHPALVDGQWHHLIGVLRRSTSDTIELWVDGVLKSTVTVPVAGRNFTSPDASRISGDSSSCWFGDLDEVAIYPTALSPSQIAAHYALRVADAYRDQVIADGAVAYWRLDEPSGTTAYDSAGSAAGTISGAVTLNQPGAVGQAMLFNPAGAADGGITIPGGAFNATGTGPATLECWMCRPPATPAGNQNICSTGSVLNPGPGLCLNVTANPDIQFRTRDAAGNITTAAIVSAVYNQLPIGVWLHLVGVVRRGASDAVELWINGVLQYTINRPTAGQDLSSGTNMTIGAHGTVAEFVTGRVDEVALYKVALTPAQIAAHFSLGATSVPVVINAVTLALLEDEDDMPLHGFNFWFPITPSDTVNQPHHTDAILVGVAGTITPTMNDNTAPVSLTVPAGAVIPIRTRRINATGTTATGLVGLVNR